MSDARGQGKLSVKTQKAGKNITITLADTGPGIPKDSLDRIFDPFFTTKEVGKGTGLGLSISFGIVHDHGGRLYAKSKPGKGTTFVVEIPITECSPSEEETTADTA
jgi:signal transduction histidine kinase